MRKILLSSVALIGIAGTAVAADLPARMPVKAPPIMAPAFSWTGCYIGGYVGGAWHDNDVVFTDRGQDLAAGGIRRAFSGGALNPRVENPHSWSTQPDSSFIGGGTLGCNWQPVGSPFVLGLEGEVGFMSLEGSGLDPLVSPAQTVLATPGRNQLDVLGSAKVGDWYGMITGRLGYAWDRTLLYVKGGVAFVSLEASVLDTCAGVGCGNWLIATSASDKIATWTVGGGLEYAFSGNWSLKAEYMFIALDEKLTTSANATLASGAIVSGGPFFFDHDFGGIHTAKVGINYRFGGGAPMMAGY